MKKAKRFAALLLVCIMLFTTACGSGSSNKGNTDAGEKKSITLALSENIKELDPHNVFNFPSYTINWMVYDALIESDREGGYDAGLATEWSHDDSGLVWTFKLREGVKFQNGEEFDSEDVVATYQRLIDNPLLACSSTYWQALKSVRAVDQYTAEITLSEPFGATEFAISNTYIIPADAWAEHGEELWTEQYAVGTGPWQLVEWVDGQYTKLKRFADSWAAYDTTLEEVTLKHILEPSTAINGQLSGDIDAYLATGGVARDMLGMYTGTEDKVEMVNQDVGIFHYVQFQCEEGSVFADEKVREAFSLAIDRQALIDYTLGAGSIPNGIIPEGAVGYDENYTPWEYDEAKAKQLLEESSYNGESFTLLTHTGIPMGKALLTPIQDMLKKVGFNVEINAIESSDLTNRRKTGDYDVFLASNNFVSGDPFEHIVSRILNDAHNSHHNDQVLNDLIAASNKEIDPEKRADLIAQANARMRETYSPQITLTQMQACYPINYGVTGIELYADGFINARNVNWDATLVK